MCEHVINPAIFHVSAIIADVYELRLFYFGKFMFTNNEFEYIWSREENQLKRNSLLRVKLHKYGCFITKLHLLVCIQENFNDVLLHYPKLRSNQLWIINSTHIFCRALVGPSEKTSRPLFTTMGLGTIVLGVDWHITIAGLWCFP